MISQSTNISELLKELTLDSNYYYLKSKNLIAYKNKDHTLYSKFKKVNKKLTSNDLKEHINKNQTIAIALNSNNTLVYEYYGKSIFAFGALLYKISKDEDIKEFLIIDYSDTKLVIFLKLNTNSSEKLRQIQNRIEKTLKEYIEKEWRVIPTNLKPEVGNLLILPREVIDNPWS